MKRHPFRTAQSRSWSVTKLSAGVLLMGLALSASARDVGETLQQQSASIGGKAGQSGSGSTPHKVRHWYQVGVASWYGTHFQGRKTADGEKFDMNRMTCAHPTLPMGTWLRVTNLKNRHSTFVRVNDRGPVVQGRIVDLSAAAARVLGLAGIGKVRLETVRETDPELAMALIDQLHTPSLLALDKQ